MMDTSYATFLRLVQRMNPTERASVEELQAQAVSYVWGWQDAGGDTRDTGVSTEFGNYYGIIAAQYALEIIYSRPPIQDAWQTYRAECQANVRAAA